MRAEIAAEELMAEAKQILNRLLKIPEGYSNEAADRFVDCVVGAAVLTVTDLLVQAKMERQAKENE